MLGEPVHSEVGDDVATVTHRLFAPVRGEQIGVVIVALAGEDFPDVKALGVGFEVPLSKDSGFVSGFLKELWEGLLVAVEAVVIVHEAIDMAVLSGENDGAAWSADGIGAEAFIEAHALTGQFVDIGSGIEHVVDPVVSSNGMRGVVVGENKDNVWLFGPRCQGDEAKE